MFLRDLGLLFWRLLISTSGILVVLDGTGALRYLTAVSAVVPKDWAIRTVLL